MIHTRLLLCCALLAAVTENLHAEEPDLIKHMAAFQYFGHKTALAIDSKNKKLASFYVHEIEHTLEEVMEIESFDGHPVGKLAGEIIQPAFENLEKALKTDSWDSVSKSFDKVIDACNYCHKTTDHGYIHVQKQTDNPYMQSFTP